MSNPLTVTFNSVTRSFGYSNSLGIPREGQSQPTDSMSPYLLGGFGVGLGGMSFDASIVSAAADSVILSPGTFADYITAPGNRNGVGVSQYELRTYHAYFIPGDLVDALGHPYAFGGYMNLVWNFVFVPANLTGVVRSIVANSTGIIATLTGQYAANSMVASDSSTTAKNLTYTYRLQITNTVPLFAAGTGTALTAGHVLSWLQNNRTTMHCSYYESFDAPLFSGYETATVVGSTTTLPPPPTAPCPVVDAVQGTPIVPVNMTGTGGSGGPYTFAAAGLPAGLSLSTSGTISGTPTVSGSFPYTGTVTDVTDYAGPFSCSLVVAPAPPPPPPPPPPLLKPWVGTQPLHARWSTTNIELLHGFNNTTQAWTDEDLVLGLANPNLVTAPIEVFLRSSAALIGSQEILNNVRIYLAGGAADIARLIHEWPAAGNGLEVSFDNGMSWIRFHAGAGDPANPATWIRLPGMAVSSVAPDGQIGPMDTAHMHLRLNVGAVPDAILSRIWIGIDCDVL